MEDDGDQAGGSIHAKWQQPAGQEKLAEMHRGLCLALGCSERKKESLGECDPDRGKERRGDREDVMTGVVAIVWILDFMSHRKAPRHPEQE
jgi:hypothetical protein